MANYEKDIYYSKIKYDEKLNDTKEAFIKGKYDGMDVDDFKREINDIWLNIDHSYMEQTIARLENQIRQENGVTLEQQRNLPNRYELNQIDVFEDIEGRFGRHIIRAYENSSSSDVDYLTKRILNFDKLERTIPYYHNGEIYSMHTPSEYLSMLYNVNLRMASWNQTIKDGQVLGIDVVKLIGHPNACPVCSEHQERLYSISGRGKYPSIDDAYKDGVGHPNCKCNFILWWGAMPVGPEVRNNYYDEIQKAQALDRSINRKYTDYKLFDYIGNIDEAEKTKDIIGVLELELEQLLLRYDIGKYLNLKSIFLTY